MATKKDSAKRLWQENFDDKPDFVDFYFDKVFKEEECVLHDDKTSGRAIAHIHLPRYKFAIAKGLEVETCYISGACTSKEFRQQGIMTSLLKETLQAEATKGELSASFLIPASQELAAYYRKHFGYETLIYRHATTDFDELLQMTENIEVKETFHDLVAFLMYCEDRMTEPHLKHSERQWKNILAEYELNEEGCLVYPIADDKGAIQGVVIGRFLDAEGLFIVDGLYGCIEGKSSCLAYIDQAHKGYTVKGYICSPNKEEGSMPYIMFRPLNILPFLLPYALRDRELDLSFSIYDELIKDNNKSYHLVNGQIEEIEYSTGKCYDIKAFTKSFVYVRHMAFLHE